MNTTSLFVELIVIGVGAICWISLIVFALFGFAWIPTGDLIPILLVIPYLAVVYVLGIVSDRLIDKLFDRIWGSSIRTTYFANTLAYFKARRTVIASSDRMADIIEYNRSRLRICRGWAVHSILIALIIPFFAYAQLGPKMALKVSIAGSILFILLSIASFVAWKHLNKMQYLKIKEQAAFLNKEAKS